MRGPRRGMSLRLSRRCGFIAGVFVLRACALLAMAGCGGGAGQAAPRSGPGDVVVGQPGVVVTLLRYSPDAPEGVAAVIEDRRVIEVAAGEQTIVIPGVAATAEDVQVESVPLARDGEGGAAGARLEWRWWRVQPGQGGAVLHARVRTARAGRHLVRLLYKARGLSWDIDYQLEVGEAGDSSPRVRLRSSLVVKNSAGWRVSGARVRLLDSGGEHGHQVVWTGTRTIEPDSRPWLHHQGKDWLPARRVYEVRADTGAETELPQWRQEAGAPGSRAREVLVVAAGSATRLGQVPSGMALGREGGAGEAVRVAPAAGGGLRLERGVGGELRVVRRQRGIARRGDTLRERYEVMVTNQGARPAAVRVIEPLLRAGVVEVIRARPAAVDERPGELVFELALEPGERAEIRYEVEYRR
jgi:hypothetical protein